MGRLPRPAGRIGLTAMIFPGRVGAPGMFVRCRAGSAGLPEDTHSGRDPLEGQSDPVGVGAWTAAWSVARRDVVWIFLTGLIHDVPPLAVGCHPGARLRSAGVRRANSVGLRDSVLRGTGFQRTRPYSTYDLRGGTVKMEHLWAASSGIPGGGSDNITPAEIRPDQVHMTGSLSMCPHPGWLWLIFGW